MSALTDRVGRNLEEIAASVSPSTTGLDEILRRIDDASAQVPAGAHAPAAEVVILDRMDEDPRRPRSWLVGVAAMLVTLAGLGTLWATRSSHDPGAGRDADGAVAADPNSTLGVWGVPWSADAAGPGRFVTTILDPAMAVTIGDGWIVDFPETDEDWSVRLPRPTSPGQSDAAVVVMRVDAVAPEEALARARQRGFTMSDPEPVIVGGRDGLRVEVLRGALEFVDSPSGAALRVDTPSQAYRVTLLTVGDAVVAVAEYAPQGSAAAIAAARAETGPIVESITWLGP